MVQQKVAAAGKTTIGWEEIAKSGAGSGTVVQHWREPELAKLGAANGAGVILSPASRAYLDMRYELLQPADKGTVWAGIVDLTTAYDWDPGAVLGASAEMAGIEAAVWTETLATGEDLDLMVFPRLAGHAALGWSPWEGHDVASYLERLGTHGPRLEAMGIGFYRAPEVNWIE